MRTSAFFRDCRESQKEQREGGRTDENAGRAGRTHARRISSGSSFDPTPMMASIENRLLLNVQNAMANQGIDAPYVTTKANMVSPRPLGPTHVLVLVETSQEERAGTKRKRNCGDYTATYSTCLEQPINDLLFILACPNLNEKIGEASYCSPLPHRLTNELPRVGVRVPNLQTFPELVIFMHNYNQADLLRKLVPQWVRDMVHPLTMAAGLVSVQETAVAKPTPRGSISSVASRDSVSSQKGWFASIFGFGRPSNTGSVSHRSSSSSISTVNSLAAHLSLSGMTNARASSTGLSTTTTLPATARTLDEVARDIAYSASRAAIADTSKESIDLVEMQMTLNALRDNLDFVGYFERSLWNELDIYKEVLTKAIIYQAQLVRD